ncbi:uncharacterized protein N7479_010368 [Penicillium vulpinum]|uniref:uncharacterized protein n=1 Tax=Penicillium vulpinum TaxID=29845 RepID=UPI002548B29E|nr:uncharacterized protein N7479_010368 [Penicillium vulpinum]KAJ5951955.1 hypothetical protein N7479_010368 [Penicillium vulpinum]
MQVTPILELPWKYANFSKAIIVGCLPPFRAIISKGPSSIQYRYGFSSGNSASHPISPHGKLRPTTTNWSEVPLPVQDYHNLDFEMHTPQAVHINGGQVGGHPNNPKDRPRRMDLEIKMVQEFSVVASK